APANDCLQVGQGLQDVAGNGSMVSGEDVGILGGSNDIFLREAVHRANGTAYRLQLLALLVQDRLMGIVIHQYYQKFLAHSSSFPPSPQRAFIIFKVTGSCSAGSS